MLVWVDVCILGGDSAGASFSSVLPFHLSPAPRVVNCYGPVDRVAIYKAMELLLGQRWHWQNGGDIRTR